MRFLVRATLPVEAGNALVRDPSFGRKMQDIVADLRSEATYYCVERGQRTIYFILQRDGSQEIPGVVEPLWQTFKADVDFMPAMNQAEMDQAAPSIEQATKKNS